MRHRWYSTIWLTLATLAVLAWSADPAAAQRGRAARGGGWGWGGNGSGYGNGWYGNGWYGNSWYGNSWYGNGWYGDGYGSRGYGWRGNFGYPYGYSWYQPYTYGYYGQQDYGDSYGYNPSDQGYTSFYSGPQEEQNAAHIDVVVPPSAQVFFDGEQTRQQGQFRRFVTPSLDPGQTFTYDIKAVWDENGKKMERDRKVRVRAGQQSSVDFMAMGRGGMQGTDYNRTDTYDRDRNRGDVERDRYRDRTDMNRTDTERNRDLNRDRTDMNRTDTERNRDRTDMNRTDMNRNRTTDTTNDRNRTEPSQEPKDQNKPPLF